MSAYIPTHTVDNASVNQIPLPAPLRPGDLTSLRTADEVLLSGILIAARDQAHLRLKRLHEEGRDWPFDPKGQIIYYVGPSPARPGQIIGSAGPTTSGRMDSLTMPFLELGVLGFLGKGRRSPEILADLKRFGAIYLAAVGGAGAYYGQLIKSARVLAWPELGPEALMELTVENFPATVVFDQKGEDLYDSGPKLYGKNMEFS